MEYNCFKTVKHNEKCAGGYRMANQEHLDILKQGVEVWNKWKQENRHIRPDLTGADLSGSRLQSFNLGRCDLNDANLSKSSLVQARLSGANLQRADLNEAILMEALMVGADLSYANLAGAELNHAQVIGCKLDYADLSYTDLTATIFNQTSFRHTD